LRRPGSEDLIRVTESPGQTADLGAALGAHALPGDFIALFGELGAGKTVFAKGFCAALGVNPATVNSPTFVLLNQYEGRLPLYHFDAYRLDGGREELAELGFFDGELDEGVVILEWAERLGELLPDHALRIRIESLDARRRRLVLEEGSERLRRALEG